MQVCENILVFNSALSSSHLFLVMKKKVAIIMSFIFTLKTIWFILTLLNHSYSIWLFVAFIWEKIRKCLEFNQKTFMKWSWICVSWYLEHYNFYSFFFLFFWQEMDPRTICWKGGAVLSILDSAQELWISQREWTSIGVRVLRERSPFIWTICN